MSIALPPGLEARLREIARQQGRDVEAVVQEALRRYVEAGAGDAGRNGANGAARPLRGTVVRYLDPYLPAAPESDWEAGR